MAANPFTFRKHVAGSSRCYDFRHGSFLLDAHCSVVVSVIVIVVVVARPPAHSSNALWDVFTISYFLCVRSPPSFTRSPPTPFAANPTFSRPSPSPSHSPHSLFVYPHPFHVQLPPPQPLSRSPPLPPSRPTPLPSYDVMIPN